MPEFAGPEESKLGPSKFEEARAAYEQKDFAAAKILAEQADMILPNQAYTLNLLGQILDRMGRSDNAEAAFRKAIAADPHFEEAENNLKDILAVKRAASTPKVALSHVPQSANSIDRMAARVKCEQAREAFQRHAVLAAKAILAEAASMNPTEACIYNLRGQILREEQHLTLAEAEFRTSIKLDPGFKDPQSNLESLMAAKQAGAANIDPPNEEMETAASRSNIEDFVRHFITVNQSKDVDAITSCYSDVVEYFGERRNRTYVREDVRKYIERWPVRQDVIEGDIQVQEEDPEDYNVGFKLNFYAGDTGGEWTRGQFTVHLRVTAATGTPKISEIKEDVVLRRKGTNKSNNPTAATTDRVQILQGSRPAYPPEAEHRGETGSGRFNIQFDDRGSATAVEIVQSTGSKILDENTIAALKSWHAVAGKAGSLVVPITYTKPNRPAPPKPGATPSSPRRR
ncbi:MAG: TonB family protein [Bryobacteraceae bacterium]